MTAPRQCPESRRLSTSSPFFRFHRGKLHLAAGAAAALAGCGTAGSPPAPAAQRREIDAAVDHALSALFTQAPQARAQANRAHGVLVFPAVLSAGLVVGGSHGQGALRKAGNTAAYYRITEASVGLQAGAQSRAVYLLFMQPGALEALESGSAWTAGLGASVVLAHSGSSARLDARATPPAVLAYVRSTTGFMAELSLDGTKVSRLPL